MLMTAGLITLGLSSLLPAATITFVDEQLNLLPVRLQSMDEKAITFYDANGNFQTRQVNDFLQLRLALDADDLKKIEDKQRGQPTPPATPAPSARVGVGLPAVEPRDAVGANEVPRAVEAKDVMAADAVAPGGGHGVEEANKQDAASTMWGVVELIDGQRLNGQFLSSDDAGQIMQWEHPHAGTLTFKLDHVRQWRFGVDSATLPNANQPNGQPAQGADRLLLANGDELLGYVVSVTVQSVTFKPQGSDQSTAIERSRVTMITLANVPVGQDQPRAMLALADGSRLLVERVLIERGQLHFVPLLQSASVSAPVSAPVSVDLAQLRQLDFANPRWQILPWTAMARQTVSDEKVFTTPWPVHEQAGALFMHAPATVTLTLPAGSSVVAARLDLDVEPTDPGRAWADFVVRLTMEGDKTVGRDPAAPVAVTELAKQAMNEQNPTGRLHAVLPKPSGSAGPRTLILTLDPALNGPIMDRLKLTDAWVVVERR